MISCPNCGKQDKSKIEFYSEKLRKQSFAMSPILPVCKLCGMEVSVTHTCKGGDIIVLNGTCGSGKSTVAEFLTKQGYLAIDGDCVMQAVKHKKGKKQVDFSEMADETAYDIDVLSLLGDRFVLSTVIMPEDLDKYIEIFKARNLRYTFFLLRPQYQTAVERCQTRTCHTSITPEYWIKHFYDALIFDSRVVVVDNTNMTVEETAEYIFKTAHATHIVQTI